jgi:hypothetical protein
VPGAALASISSNFSANLPGVISTLGSTMQSPSPTFSSTAAARLAIGLAQGIALHLLYLAAEEGVWPATHGMVFAPMLVVAWFVPVLLLLGLGNIRWRTLVVWGTAAALLLAGLAAHDIARGGASDSYWFWGVRAAESPRLFPSSILAPFVMIGLFIAQALIVAGDTDRKLIAFYPRHFDAAWKHGVQLALAAVFVGVFWLLLWLGAGLFKLINIEFFTRFIEHRWFALPVTTLALACAIHVTDVRAGIVRGMRTLILILASWLLPLLTLIVVGFLASLPFTGLAPLWSTRFATSLLLTAAAALVVLVNAAYQDGDAEHAPPRLIRYAGSLAALALTPLVAIAGYALALRVEQHGWTTDRIIAAACVLVGACYALGYGWGVFRRGIWLKPLEGCNVAAAFVVLGVLLALFTPLADPARISVASQLARLETGKVAADKFDFAYLRFQGARYGMEALERLKASAHGPGADVVKRRAAQALAQKYRWEQPAVEVTPEQRAGNITVYPATGTLPETFLRQNWAANQPQLWLVPRCLVEEAAKCEAYLLDLDGDGTDEIVVLDLSRPAIARTFKQTADGAWRDIGGLSCLVGCDKVRAAFRNGELKLVPTDWRDIEAGGVRLRVEPTPGAAQDNCP